MIEVNISVRGMDVDYKAAHRIAQSVAGMHNREPALVAWHDEPRHRMSPVIKGTDVHTRWRDYGAAYGGRVNISINGDYDFIYADSAEYQDLEEPHPYISVRDKDGNEYLCLMENLKDRSNPREQACVEVAETGLYG